MAHPTRVGIGVDNNMVTIDGGILGNGDGLDVRAAGVEIYGMRLTSYSGTTLNGTIRVDGDLNDNVIIGAIGKGNVINNNGGNGIYIVDADGTSIKGNRIGTTSDGSGPSGNANGISTTGSIDGLTIGETPASVRVISSQVQ